MSVTLQIEGIEKIESSFVGAAQALLPAMAGELRNAAQQVTEVMKSNVKVSRGDFRDSIDYNIESVGRDMIAIIGPNEGRIPLGGGRAGVAVDLERPSGRGVPITALMYRYGLTPGQAIKASKTIKERAIPGIKFIEQTAQEVPNILENAATTIWHDIVER